MCSISLLYWRCTVVEEDYLELIKEFYDEEVIEKSVFGSSSITKIFISILLLKKAENGNIYLNKKFSDYSSLLKNVDASIYISSRNAKNDRNKLI